MNIDILNSNNGRPTIQYYNITQLTVRAYSSLRDLGMLNKSAITKNV